MKRRRQKVLFLCSGFVLFLVGFLFQIKNINTAEFAKAELLHQEDRYSLKVVETFSRNIKQQTKQERPELHAVKKHKKFIYLIQTEQCLPQMLLQKEYLGNSSLCRCDVLVLSFKRDCREDNRFHVEYLYGKNTSWSEGRNILYRRAQARNSHYLYYIFLDDDIQFGYKDAYTPAEMKLTMAPLRAFEEFLVSHEPAIGVANYQTHHDADVMNKKFRQICTSDENRKRPQNVMYISIVHFDASFNAFHRDAINYILPYPTEYDNVCWWHSQRYVIAAVEMIFRGHAVMFAPVEARNVAHGLYPRNDQGAGNIWSSMVTALRYHVPKEFENETWIQDFINNPVKFTETSPSICFDFPPHHPIQPYSHFKMRWNE